MTVTSPFPRHLGDLQPGARARVTAVRAEIGIARRLMIMGLLPGATVEVVGVAPFGDPVAIRLNDNILSLRRADAAPVEIEPA